QRGHALPRRLGKGIEVLHQSLDVSRRQSDVPTELLALKLSAATAPPVPHPAILEAPPSPELLSALGRRARGLSVIFWGLPIALVVCVQSAKGDWLRPLGVIPPLTATGLLLYGLTLLGHFQKQERVWSAALERVKLFALIN